MCLAMTKRMVLNGSFGHTNLDKRKIIIVNRLEDAGKRAFMRLKLHSANIRDFSIFDSFDCHSNADCMKYADGLERNFKKETRSSIMKVTFIQTIYLQFVL